MGDIVQFFGLQGPVDLVILGGLLVCVLIVCALVLRNPR